MDPENENLILSCDEPDEELVKKPDEELVKKSVEELVKKPVEEIVKKKFLVALKELYNVIQIEIPQKAPESVSDVHKKVGTQIVELYNDTESFEYLGVIYGKVHSDIIKKYPKLGNGEEGSKRIIYCGFKDYLNKIINQGSGKTLKEVIDEVKERAVEGIIENNCLDALKELYNATQIKPPAEAPEDLSDVHEEVGKQIMALHNTERFEYLGVIYCKVRDRITTARPTLGNGAKESEYRIYCGFKDYLDKIMKQGSGKTLKEVIDEVKEKSQEIETKREGEKNQNQRREKIENLNQMEEQGKQIQQVRPTNRITPQKENNKPSVKQNEKCH